MSFSSEKSRIRSTLREENNAEIVDFSHSFEIEKLKEKIRNQELTILDLTNRLEISTKQNEEIGKESVGIPVFENLWKDKYYNEIKKNEELESAIKNEQEKCNQMNQKISIAHEKIEKLNNEFPKILDAASHFTGFQIASLPSFYSYFESSTINEQIENAKKPLIKLMKDLEKEESESSKLRTELKIVKAAAKKLNGMMKTRETEYNKTISTLKKQIFYQNEAMKEAPQQKEPAKIEVVKPAPKNAVFSKGRMNVFVHFNGITLEPSKSINKKEMKLAKSLIKLQRKNAELSQRIIEIDNQREIFKSTVKKQRFLLDEKTKQEEENSTRIDNMKTAIMKSCKKSDLQNALMVISSLKEKVFLYKQQVEELKGERASYIERNSSLDEDIKSCNEKFEAVSYENAKLKEKNNEMNDKITKLSEELVSLKEKYEEASSRKDSISLTIDDLPSDANEYIRNVLDNDSLQTQAKFELCIRKVIDVYESINELQREDGNKNRAGYEKLKAKVSDFISKVSLSVIGYSISLDSFMNDQYTVDKIIRKIKQIY